jgi:uncharacterized protein (TIGR03437 family)
MAIPVLLGSSGASVSAIQFDISYDPAALSVSAAIGDPAREQGKSLYTSDPDGHTKRLLIAGLNSHALPNGPLVVLEIAVQPGASEGTYPLRFSNAYASNGEGSAVNLMTADGSIEVSQLPPTGGITMQGVRNAASLLPGPVAPGELITIFGSGIGVPGVAVTFDGSPAAVLYAGGDQVNCLAPAGFAGRTEVHLAVRGPDFSHELAVPAASAAPGIFTHQGNGAGPGIIVNEDGAQNSALVPAAKGSIVAIYATGIPLEGVSAEIGGAPAQTIAVEPLPGTPGVLQVRARVPEGTASGAASPVVIMAGEARSQPGVTIALQ